jgi:hypothetical protein
MTESEAIRTDHRRMVTGAFMAMLDLFDSDDVDPAADRYRYCRCERQFRAA